MTHWIFDESHELFRKTVRRFVEKEIAPHVEKWEKAGSVPRSLFNRLGELGYLGIPYSESYGGMEADYIMETIFVEELTKCGAAGVAVSVMAHAGMAAGLIWQHGTEEQKQRYLAPAIQGTAIAAWGFAGPQSNSVGSLTEIYAKKIGDHYVLNGKQKLVVNGAFADFIVVAAKTSEQTDGFSLFIADMNTKGCIVSRNEKKLGWRSADTAEIHFENARISPSGLLGGQNEGRRQLAENAVREQTMFAASSVALAEAALQEAMQYSNERIQFGKPIRQFQVLRHKMVDMAVGIEKARHITYRAVYNYSRGQDAVTAAAMAKSFSGEMARRVSDQAVQIHGGNGYMMEYPVQRHWRDARLYSVIGGTTEEIQDMLSDQLGIKGERREGGLLLHG